MVLDLGEMSLTGIFPTSPNDVVARGPLQLVRANDECGLLQLKQTYDLDMMYGGDYGYRSGLNASMVRHLEALSRYAQGLVNLAPGDLVVDIGSNDGTLLSTYPEKLRLVGVDPTASKFREFYPPHAEIIPDFFPSPRLEGGPAKLVTSISCFYDLERPLDFAQAVAKLLDDDGVWIAEQAYVLPVIEHNAYDVVCHEHLELYGMRQIKWIADHAGLRIVDVSVNDVNGGSFCVTFAKSGQPSPRVDELLGREDDAGLSERDTYLAWGEQVDAHRRELCELLGNIASDGKTVVGYGASTKGNVVLQYCGLTSAEIPCIAEVNASKFGCYTPGSLIPIVPEEEARQRTPDYYLVLPWHFREHILERERGNAAKFIFPLPRIEVV